MVNETLVGAVSLVINFPADMVEISGIKIDNNPGNLRWAAKGNELRISWHSPDPLDLASSDPLLILQMKTKADFTPGNNIRLELAPDPLNELADELYNVIGDAMISVESVDAAPLGINEPWTPDPLLLTCYPNPSRGFTVIAYTLPYDGQVTLVINNMLGSQAACPVNEIQSSGDHMLRFNTNNLPEGVYTVTLRLRSQLDDTIKTIKLIIK
jgi:hypothetical protein